MAMEFGTTPTNKKDRPIRLAVPSKPVNAVEQELIAKMYEEMPSVPCVFVEDGSVGNSGDFKRYYGRMFSVSDAMLLVEFAEEPTAEKFRRQICTARELGPEGTFELYAIACELQGIPTLIEENDHGFFDR